MEAQFRSSLKFQDNDGLPFTLLDDLIYISAIGKNPTAIFPFGQFGVIRVPTGFKTDLASIPQFLWSVLPPVGRYDRAAVVHDFLYRCGGCTRKEADDVLFEAMTVLGVRFTQRWTIYAGVRAGGWLPWNKYREGKPGTV